MSILKIGWDEREFYHQHGVYLNEEKIGFIQINIEEDAIILFNIEIGEQYRGKGYFPQILELIAAKGKDDGLSYMIVQWLTPPEKLSSLEKRGFKRLEVNESRRFHVPLRHPDGEAEVSAIKQI